MARPRERSIRDRRRASRTALPAAAEVRIERIGSEGDGIARLPDGAPLYIRGALPDEIVRARPVAPRGEGWAAEVESISTTSPDRISPPCAHFGLCGGCTLQHWQDSAYTEWKAGLLRQALRRAGYTNPRLSPIVRTPPGARRCVDLALRRTENGVAVGLHERRSDRVVDVRSCLVMHPIVFGLLDPLREVLPMLNGLHRAGTACINLLDCGPDLLLRTDAALSTGDRGRLADFARAHNLPRIAWSQGDNEAEPVCVLHPPRIRFGDVDVMPPPGAFLQASADGERAIVASVLAGLPVATRRMQVAEFYAGCGTITFALTKQARVTAWEGNLAAADALDAAARKGNLAGQISVQRRDLARQPVPAQALSSYAAAVLDPPHAGAPAQLAQIAAAFLSRVIYVSCNPAALARDARLLREAGYQIVTATPIDQFLWSAELESVVVFAR